MHIGKALAKHACDAVVLCIGAKNYVKSTTWKRSVDVFAANGQVLGRFDAHFDPSARSAEQGDLDRAVGEQLREGHVAVRTIGGLYDDRFIGAAAEH
jgi:hypothetical protein